MKASSLRKNLVSLLWSLPLLAACSSESPPIIVIIDGSGGSTESDAEGSSTDESGGSGGDPSTSGGSTSRGGSPEGTGGSISTGGVISTGGSTGGSISTGGSTGGSISTGGSTGGSISTGGSTGGSISTGGSTGGSISTGGSPGRSPITFAFDSGLGDLFLDYEESVVDTTNMGGAFSSSLSWEPSDGEPESGAAQLTIPFESLTFPDHDQTFQKAHVAIGLDAALDLSGKDAIASVNVKLLSVPSVDCPIHAKIWVKDAVFSWANGSSQNLSQDEWQTLTIAPWTPDYQVEEFNAAEVTWVGVEIAREMTGDCADSEVVVLIDTFVL